MSHDRRIVHSSEDPNWRTPREIVRPLDDQFGFLFDAAANEDDAVVPRWLGPGSPWGENALVVDWRTTRDHLFRKYDQNFIGSRTAIWLNPPYSKTLINAYNTGRIKRDGMWYSHEKNPDKAATYDIANWARKCYGEARDSCTIVGLFPYTPQTTWFRRWVYGHAVDEDGQITGPVMYGRYQPPDRPFFCADSVWKLPRRISFIRADTNEKEGNAGVNHCIITWRPDPGYVGPWQPTERYWDWE